MVAFAATKTATVAVPDVVELHDIMAAFHISVLAYNSRLRPRLKYQCRTRLPNGKVKRSFHETKGQAEAARSAKLTEIENVGIDALNIDTRTRLEVISALGKLKPFEVTLSQAVDFFVDHHSANCTVEEACDLYLAGRKSKHWSALHRRNLRSIITRFVAAFGPRSLSTVKPEEIEKWLDALGVAPVSVNSYRGLLFAVCAFAKKRKLVKINPFEDIEPLKVVRDKIGILTPHQMHVLLLVAAEKDPEVLAAVALGAFAGIRPDEVGRLSWGDIDLDHGQIDCGSAITKTARHRYVKIEPVLAAWLKPAMCLFSTSNEASKRHIQTANFRRRFRRVRWLAGFKTPGVLVLKPKPSGQESATPEELAAFTANHVRWPQDCLRHSFASYHLAHFKDAQGLSLQMGHETTKLIFSTYRERVKASDAVAWWNLLPEVKP